MRGGIFSNKLAQFHRTVGAPTAEKRFGQRIAQEAQGRIRAFFDAPPRPRTLPIAAVHKGFQKALANLHTCSATCRTLMEIIEEKENGEERRPLLITGHSLGGAMATLFAYDLVQAGDRCIDLIKQSDKKFKSANNVMA